MRFSFDFRSMIAATSTVAALACVLTAPTSAQAQTYFSNLTSFNNAATTTLHDFEGITPANTFSTNPAVLTVAAPGRVTFSVTGGMASASGVYAVDSGFAPGIYDVNGTDCVLAGTSMSGNLATTKISLDSLYTAFAVEIGQAGSVTGNYTIGLYNGDTQVGTNLVTGVVNTGYFYGVTSATAFNNVRVLATQYTGDSTMFDNARTGSVTTSNAVPEAGTAALILPALGMIGVVVLRRKK